MEIRRDVFQAIADPTRRAILSHLRTHPSTPGAIAEKFDSARQTISKHIQILYECELLQQTTKGREYFYYLNPHKMKEVADWVEPYRKLWEDRFDAMAEILTETQPARLKSKRKPTLKRR